MNKDKFVSWLVESADEIYTDGQNGDYTIPGGASVPEDAGMAFAKGIEYAYRNILGYIAAGIFNGNTE